MVDLERLTARGRRAYELGRLRMAARVVLVLGPLGGLAVWAAADRETCGCVFALLLGVTVWARWRSGVGVEAVRAGSVAGAAGLGLAWGLSALGGLGTGWGTALLAAGGCGATAAASRGAGGTWLGALVCTLFVALGCVDLGPAGGWVLLGCALGAAAGRLARAG